MHPARDLNGLMILLMRCADFDLDNQRSIESLSAVKIVPLQIESGEDFSASVLDYLAASTRLVVDEPSRLFELLQKLLH